MNIFEEFRKVLAIDPENLDEFDLIDPLIIEMYSTQGEYQYLSENFILMQGKLGMSQSALKDLATLNKP